MNPQQVVDILNKAMKDDYIVFELFESSPGQYKGLKSSVVTSQWDTGYDKALLSKVVKQNAYLIRAAGIFAHRGEHLSIKF
jgi:hypothetical protein